MNKKQILEMKQQSLPKGWIKTQIGTITQPSKEKFEPQNSKSRIFVGLEHIETNTNKILKKGNSKNTKSTKTVFHAGDILYGRLRPYLNKVCIPNFDGVCSTDILVFPKNNNFSSRYVLHFLSLPKFVSFATRNSTGVQHPRIKFDAISKYDIPLPPLNEQKRIVFKVESTCTQIDTAEKYLTSTLILLNSLKISTLKQAFEGRLVPQDPNNESVETLLKKTHKRSEKNLNFEKKDNLPKKWKTIILDDYVSIAGRIGWRGLKKSEYTNEGPFLLSVKDIDKSGRINYNEVKDHLSEFRYEESPEIQLREDDILITKDGTIGKIGYVDKIHSPATVNSSILVVRPEAPILPKYLFYYFRSSFFQQIVREKVKGIAIPHLFQYDIKKIHLRVAPLSEQRHIVTKIESIFGRIDAIDRHVTELLSTLNMLRGSVLRQACEGKLVKQDPHDEPANKLLERIRGVNSV